MRALRLPLAVAAVALGLSGCATVLPEAESLAAVGADETVLVGRFEIRPSLADDEQKLGLMYKGFKGEVYMQVGDEPRGLVDMTRQRADRVFVARVGEPFYVRVPARAFYILGGSMYVDLRVNQQPKAVTMPLYLKVDARPGDRAVYVGTIQFHRDEFFGPEKIVVRDDYGQARAAFARRFGEKAALRRALAAPARRREADAR